jgi:cytidylate kinase
MSDRTGKELIITIDGPSGAGKSTVAKMLAAVLKYRYVDTGAMYRGLAYAYMEKGEPEDVSGFLKDLSIEFTFGSDTKVFLDGEDISSQIRDPRVSLLASRFSQNRAVREYLTGKQRDIGKDGGIVLEGRDTGSVVFPKGDVKFFLDANLDERARRRQLELSEKGTNAELATVEKEMAERDRNDRSRDIAPLVLPEGAVRVDTTGIDAKRVVDIMVQHVKGRSR